MNLQNTFYTVGIIYMTLYTLLLIAIFILMFYIKKKIDDVHNEIEGKMKTVKQVVTHPRQIAKEVFGETLTQTARNLKKKKRR